MATVCLLCCVVHRIKQPTMSRQMHSCFPEKFADVHCTYALDSFPFIDSVLPFSLHPSPLLPKHHRPMSQYSFSGMKGRGALAGLSSLMWTSMARAPYKRIHDYWALRKIGISPGVDTCRFKNTWHHFAALAFFDTETKFNVHASVWNIIEVDGQHLFIRKSV